MIDTGSTISILNSNRVPSNLYENIKDTPIQISTIQGTVTSTSQVKTKCPDQFNQPCNARMKFAKIELDKPYDFLIGMDWIKSNAKSIDIINEEIILRNDIHLPFLNILHEDVNVLEVSEVCNIQTNHLNELEKESIEKLLKKYKKLIYTEGDQLTNTDTVVHEINTTTDQQINSKLYRYPPKHDLEVRRQMEEMEKQGIIRKSKSRYSSPIIVIPKKIDNSGIQKYRIVVDYRRLNQITIDDKYPIPNIDSILDKLGKSQYFSTLDLAKGYHQILVAEKDIEKTAFVTPVGLYEYVRMPFGLKNAPATFQRLMNEILRDYINKICVVYLDDILIFSTTLEEHMQSLEKVFKKLQENNLKIQADKCSFMKRDTEFLGHILTKEGIKPNPNKIKEIENLKLPKTEKKLKGFLGMTGYYRKFIRDYAKIAYPMIRYLKKDENININDPQYISAFENLKALITTHPILKYPEYDKPFVVTTDASNYAIGAVLSQNGHPICFVSRTLNKHEQKYSVTDKEFLAIVYSVNYFRPYLYGNHFKIITDHIPIKYLNSKYKGKEFSQRNQRWLLKLQEYNFEIEYLKGKENKVADFLSRLENAPKINEDNESESNMELTETVHSVDEQQLDHIGIKEEIVNKYKTQLILTYSKITNEIMILHERRIIYLNPLEGVDKIKDVLIRFIKKGKTGIYSEVEDHDYNKVQQVIVELFSMNEKVKFIKCTDRASEVETEEEIHKQISLYHTKESMHSGINETYYTLKNKFFFPKLQQQIQLVINNCKKCQEIKYDRKPIKPKYKLTETPKQKNQIIHLDIFHIQKKAFLTIIDKLTKFAVGYVITDRNWRSKKAILIEHFSKFGKPEKIISDNEFKSEHILDFLNKNNVEIHFTKPNSHTGNADIERLHSTILEKITGIEEKDLSIEMKLQLVLDNYNNRYHSTIKTTPKIAKEKISESTLYERIEQMKIKTINKLNEKRETYSEKREVGPIKNYKNVRHKEQPRYKIKKLDNVHPINIKRPYKFAGNNSHNYNSDHTNDQRNITYNTN